MKRWLSKGVLGCVVFAAGYILLPSESAGLKMPITLENKVQKSDLIFTGQVVSTKRVWLEEVYPGEKPHRRDYARVQFSLKKVMEDGKGVIKPGSALVELYFGLTADSVEFSVGEDMLLILYARRRQFTDPAPMSAAGEIFVIRAVGRTSRAFDEHGCPVTKIIDRKKVRPTKDNAWREISFFSEKDRDIVIGYGEKEDKAISADIFISEVEKLVRKKRARMKGQEK